MKSFGYPGDVSTVHLTLSKRTRLPAAKTRNGVLIANMGKRFFSSLILQTRSQAHQPPVHWVPGTSAQGVKLTGTKAKN